ncbi:MAG: winged helix-turn-helix domain-containing protein [Acidobacteriota bacterium]
MARRRNILEDGNLSLHLENCQVLVGKKRIDLTATESNLLACLLERRGDPVSRQELIDQVWGSNYQGTQRTVDTHIQRIRLKLGRSGWRIQSVRGIGYRLT